MDLRERCEDFVEGGQQTRLVNLGTMSSTGYLGRYSGKLSQARVNHHGRHHRHHYRQRVSLINWLAYVTIEEPVRLADGPKL